MTIGSGSGVLTIGSGSGVLKIISFGWSISSGVLGRLLGSLENIIRPPGNTRLSGVLPTNLSKVVVLCVIIVDMRAVLLIDDIPLNGKHLPINRSSVNDFVRISSLFFMYSPTIALIIAGLFRRDIPAISFFKQMIFNSSIVRLPRRARNCCSLSLSSIFLDSLVVCPLVDKSEIVVLSSFICCI